MIKLEGVNKYFNKGKPNEIHVIDNTSMELPDHGIVCLLGPSGCGKTTLLNAIGGLDSVNSGKIYIDDQLITRSSANKIDTIRNARIGYIFQNFNLIDDKTVFENVAIALRMIGIKDNKVIRERVKYCLEKTGIYQYRNRNTSALSGGQRQRVAIARAIVKNPQIIIADEPTGNLDSANTLEVMNIIKKISKERLVLLVTHERNIADFYSDYVAEMKDGRIVKAYSNDSSKFLDYQLENKLYLKDMAVEKDFAQDDVRVRVYSDDERQADIKLVIRGGNLYIDTGGKFNVVDENSNIEMVDDHYQAMDESYFDKSDFDYGAYLPPKYKAKYTSIYKMSNFLVRGWETVKNFKKVRKFLMLGFVAAAMFAFLAVSNVLGLYDVHPEDYRKTNEHYITVNNPEKSENLISAVEDLSDVSFVIPGDTKIVVNMPMDDYLQTSYATSSLGVSLCKTDVIDQSDIVYGEMPSDDHDVVIDMFTVNTFLRNEIGKSVGIDSAEKFIGRTIKIGNLDDYRISGISDTNSPSLYADDSQILYILTNAGTGDVTYVQGYAYTESEEDVSDDPIKSGQVKEQNQVSGKLKIKKGSAPKDLYEAVVSSKYIDDESYKIGKTLSIKMGGHKLRIVGYYETSNTAEETIYVDESTIMKDYVSKQKNFTAYTSSPKKVKSLLDSQHVSSKINDTTERNSYISERKNQLSSALIVAAIIMFIALIEMFLMLRSSFLSRIKEVGTLRAIGLKKRDIYRMFAGEIIVITLVTAIPGIAIMYYILSNVVTITYYLESMYQINMLVAVIAFLIVLVFNLLSGLIPVFFTMRKTPAQILARTDI